MRLAVVIAVALLLDGCASLPPILQRWAGLEIATLTLLRDDLKADESFNFSQDGLVQVSPKASDWPAVAWRVRGEWLEIDTKDDGTFQTRLRALTVEDGRIVAENPEGKKSVWRYTSIIVTMPEGKTPGGFASLGIKRRSVDEL